MVRLTKVLHNYAPNAILPTHALSEPLSLSAQVNLKFKFLGGIPRDVALGALSGHCSLSAHVIIVGQLSKLPNPSTSPLLNFLSNSFFLFSSSPSSLTLSENSLSSHSLPYSLSKIPLLDKKVNDCFWVFVFLCSGTILPSLALGLAEKSNLKEATTISV